MEHRTAGRRAGAGAELSEEKLPDDWNGTFNRAYDLAGAFVYGDAVVQASLENTSDDQLTIDEVRPVNMRVVCPPSALLVLYGSEGGDLVEMHFNLEAARPIAHENLGDSISTEPYFERHRIDIPAGSSKTLQLTFDVAKRAYTFDIGLQYVLNGATYTQVIRRPKGRSGLPPTSAPRQAERQELGEGGRRPAQGTPVPADPAAYRRGGRERRLPRQEHQPRILRAEVRYLVRVASWRKAICGARSALVIVAVAAGAAALSRQSKAAPAAPVLRAPAAQAGPPPQPVGPAVESLTAYEKATLTATNRQAWGTVVGAVAATAALLISAGALVISLRTWQSQSDREDKIYAAQVSLWATLGEHESSVRPAGLDVHVQNRAPVPVHQARISATLTSGEKAELRIGVLQPCTELSFRIAPPSGGAFVKGDEQWLGYTALELDFVETSRVWRLTKDNLARRSELPARGTTARLIQIGQRQEDPGDCG